MKCSHFLILIGIQIFKLELSRSQMLQVSEWNTSKVFVELLRGRDGLPGPAGPPGKDCKQGKELPSGSLNGMVTYTRWGARSCPNSIDLVYTGIAGGNIYSNNGGGANFLCMPMDPEYELPHIPGVRGHSTIGAIGYNHPISGGHAALAACCVCQVKNRSAVIMIPAKANCPATWTREYYGYLMTEYSSSNVHSRYTYECIDRQMDTAQGFQNSSTATLFNHVEVLCGKGLVCAPGKYSSVKEMNCVVCSK